MTALRPVKEKGKNDGEKRTSGKKKKKNSNHGMGKSRKDPQDSRESERLGGEKVRKGKNS